MGTVNLPPVEPKGQKTTDEWLLHIANVLSMIKDETENIFDGRLSSLNIRELTADKIRTGELLAALVTIRANLTGTAFIRIDGNGMVINDGTNDVFVVDINGNVTMTSATIQSTPTGERVVIDDTGIHTYNASNIERITIGTTPAKGVKGITTRDELGVEQGLYAYDTGNVDGADRTGQYITAHGAYILLDSSGTIRMQTDTSTAGEGFRARKLARPEINDGGGWAAIAKKSEADARGFTLAYNSATKDLSLKDRNGITLSTVNLT